MALGHYAAPMTTVTIEQALEMAIAHQKAGRASEAASIYRQVLAVQPANAVANHNLGLIVMSGGQNDEAADLFRAAIAASPQVSGFHNSLATALKNRGRHEEALAAYDAAVACNPSDAVAWSNRGVVLEALDRPSEALEAFRRSVELRPDYDAGWCNLGGALSKAGAAHDALAAFRAALRLQPANLEARFGAVHTLVSLGDFPGAIALLQELAPVADHPAFPRARYARLLAEAGQREAARDLLVQSLARDPSDSAGARPVLAALGFEAPPERASDAMMRRLYAERARFWDAASQGYRAAQLTADALAARLEQPVDILDAGCGTGLAGPLLRPLARRLEGIDLSGAMLAEAESKKVYDALHEAELVGFLRARSGRFDAIACAATLLHFGDLAQPLAAAHGALRPAGLMALTVLPHPSPGEFDVDPKNPHGGIFRHGAEYVRSACSKAGFEVLALREEIHEHAESKPVMGLLAVLRAQPK